MSRRDLTNGTQALHEGRGLVRHLRSRHQMLDKRCRMQAAARRGGRSTCGLGIVVLSNERLEVRSGRMGCSREACAWRKSNSQSSLPLLGEEGEQARTVECDRTNWPAGVAATEGHS